MTDRELLERYVATGHGRAFEALVAGHADMVCSVCRRILGDEHAAEDAAQATFLLLAHKAGSLSRRTVRDHSEAGQAGAAPRSAMGAEAFTSPANGSELPLNPTA
ncbi:MAG: RNA polymerase sigma factor [Planctomycetota bacterium]|jgi:hypothetical protein